MQKINLYQQVIFYFWDICFQLLCLFDNNQGNIILLLQSSINRRQNTQIMNSQKKPKKTNSNKNKTETMSNKNTDPTGETHYVGTGDSTSKIDNANTQKVNNKTQSSKGSQVSTVGNPVNASNSANTAAEMTKQKKHILKQQAKQLLLKQCYKLSSNKYRHLLSLGPEHFTPREWSIIHLNYAITLQFMDKLQQALQQLNLAIKIDHLYEKPYYRRLQVLQELGLYDVVAEQAIVPPFINNPQIIALKQQICSKYHQMVGIEYIQNKVKQYVQNAQQYEAANIAQKQKKQMEEGNKIFQLVKNSHNSILNKIIEQIDNNIVRIHSNRQKVQLSANLKSISNKLFKYYAYVKDMLFEQSYKNEVSNQDNNKNINGSTSKVSLKYITLRKILQQIFELVYKLCSKYWIVNFDKKQVTVQSNPQTQQKNGLITDMKQIGLAVLLLFLIHFWEMFMEQFSNYMDEGDLSQLLLGRMSGLTYDQFQDLMQSNKNLKVENKQHYQKDLQNKLGAYQQILICYCPVVLFNPQVFLSVLQYLQRALILSSKEPLNLDTALKLLYNNNLQLHIYTLMQKDDKLKIKKDWKDQSFLYSVFGQISQSDTKNLTAFINKYLVKLSNFSGQASMISLYQQKLRQLQKIGNKQSEQAHEQQTSSYKISRYKKQTVISHILLQLQETFLQCQPFPSTDNATKVNKTAALPYILRQMYNIQQSIKYIQQKAEQVDPKIVGLIEDVLDVMVKNLFSNISGKQSHHINYIKFSNIFTIYKFFHEMQPFLYRKGANKSPVKNISAHLQSLQHKLIQILLDTGTSEHILQIMKNKNDRSVQDVNAVIKYIVIVDILGYVSPSFYRKFVTSAINNTNSSNSNDKYKLFNSVWEHLCNVEDIFITIVKQYTHHNRIVKDKADRIKNVQMDNIGEVCLLHIQCMTIMSISHPTFTSQMLSYPTILTKLYSLIYISPLYPRKSPILPIVPLTLLFSLTTNVIEQQQAQYAQKMGTSVQEIRKAKKLQGDAYPQELLQLLDKKRGLFLGKIVGNKGLYKDNPAFNETNTIIDQIIVNDNTWTQIINHIVVSVNKMNEQNPNFSKQYNPEQKMLVSILSALSQKQPSKFRTAPIITLMFSHYKKEKPTPLTPIVYKICMYFVSILKKCNPSIFPYHQLQSLTNMPVFFIVHRLAKHELEIFQAFLGLVAVSSQNICINLDCIYLGLLEENQYIVHGALETFNNILVNLQYSGNQYYMHSKDKDPKIKYRDEISFWSMLIKIQQYVYKYYKIYKSLILKQLQQQQNESINTSDYSHPFKIYSTLISVILLLEPLFQTILPPTVPPSVTPVITPTPLTPKTTTPELQSWAECARVMKIIQDNNGDIAILLFKMVLHHVERGTLPNNWHLDFQDGINKLKIMDIEKWGKISKYIK